MNQRVTVTLPEEIVRTIERLAHNPSKFILQAIGNELDRRQRQALRDSLRAPHPQSSALAETGIVQWARELPRGDQELVDPDAGHQVCWIPGKGWRTEE